MAERPRIDIERRRARWPRQSASVAVDDRGGLAWPLAPGAYPDLAPSLGWGGLGPILFFAQAARQDFDPRYLQLAERGATWTRSWLESPSDELPPGLFTGLAGFAVAFEELHRADVDTNDDLVRVFEWLRQTATETEAGLQWWDTTEVLWGTAGIGFVFLSIGPRVLGNVAIHMAARAGDWLLSVAYETPEGLRWDLGERANRLRPHRRGLWYPNFAHGTAGIAAFLAHLSAVTGDERYLDAALRGASWILTTCRTDDETCAARHHDSEAFPGDEGMGPLRDPNDVSPMYTLGWCHGPPGLGWLFRELQLATGSDGWGDWIARTARAVRRSGIPERREPGFWDNVGRCCGSAGVAEYFLDLHVWRDDPDDVAFARLIIDDVLDRALVDGDGMRWSNIEFRHDPPELPAQTTLFQGASGIGLTLLRLARHLDGERSGVRWPHAPDWSTEATAGPLVSQAS